MAFDRDQIKKTSIALTLGQCPLFKGLTRDELDEIVGFTELKPYPKGSYCFHQGDEQVGFFVVQQGSVSVHRVNPEGREQVIHIFRPGESFAEGTLADPAGYPADARALEDSQMLLVRKDAFLGLIQKRPELALRLLASMSAHLRLLVRQIEQLTLHDVESRLIRWLQDHCPDIESTEPCRFELEITKKVLASEIGTISETLSRTLSRLRERGLLIVEGKSFTIPSPAVLNAAARGKRHGP